MEGLRGEGGEWIYKGSKPLRGWDFLTVSGRLIVSTGHYFHFFYVKLCIETKFTFTLCVVEVNSAQLINACDQGQTVETCCAEQFNKSLCVSKGCYCLKRGQGKYGAKNDNIFLLE